MKLLFCDNSLKELINFRGDIIQHLNNNNSIVIVAPDNNNKKGVDSSLTYYSSIVDRSGMNPIKDLGYMISLYKIYKKEKPDIIFHYTIKPNVYGSVAAWLLGIPSVAMVTGLGYAFNHNNIKSRIARALYRFSMKFPQKIFILNQNNLETLLNYSIITRDKAVLLPGGEGINLDIYK